MNDLKTLTLALLILCGFPTPSLAQQKRSLDAYTLPSTTSPYIHIPLVTVILADNKRHKFVVDTGAPSSIIDTAVPRQLNLLIQTMPAQDGSKVDVVTTRADFGPGVLALPQLPLVLSDLSAIRQADAAIDGILGTNVLNNFAVLFDSARQQITLLPGGKVAGTLFEPQGAQRIPLTREDNYWLVEVVLDEKKLLVEIDTGSEYNFSEDLDLLNSLKPIWSMEGPRSGILVNNNANTAVIY